MNIISDDLSINFEGWTEIKHFNVDDFYTYLYTLPEEQQAHELEMFGKQQSLVLLKNDMVRFNNFYEFIKQYSPRDYKILNNKPYVSQRVIIKHVQLWNELHTAEIKRLRIFFL